ncbi:hypothetical protein KI387_016251 [Taxus chinensis]|uniref:PHD-type zinc finger plants domain-containing protein n=1 Tax=Taxus chinensis TaxID=29808 RepID=A0AA38GDG0_TAXCH|nr:hypothetical protein KI387_016251 [Taxus chinensis]
MKRAKECCMCGDTGFSHELFQCTACLHRFQHTYCSCMYPKAESYHTCDWCLRSGEGRKTSKQIIENPKKVSYGGRICLPGLHAIKKHKPILPERAHVQTANPNTSVKTQKFGYEITHKQRVEPAEKGTLNCVKNDISRCKDIFGNKAAVAIAGSKASNPQLVKGKVRRYKLLEEVSA